MEIQNGQRLVDLDELAISSLSDLPSGKTVACAGFDHRSIFMHEIMVVKRDEMGRERTELALWDILTSSSAT